MTYREWMVKNKPDTVDPKCGGGVYACPDAYFPGAGVPHYCHDTTISSDERCRRCWDREIPEDRCSCYIEENGVFRCYGTKNREECSCNGDKKNCTFYPVKTRVITDACFAEDGYSPKLEPTIKDSGDRTRFETGAVRDMREGKGRCDLMPLEVVAQVLGGTGDLISYDTVINDIHVFKKTGDTDYLYYALDRFASAAYGKTTSMLLETAIHFEDGAKKYGPNNWQKGIPVYCYIDSAVRHYLKWLRGDKDEPHDRAFVWNILCAIWTCINKPELNSYSKEE